MAIHENIATIKSIDIQYDVTKQWGSYSPTFDMFMTVMINKGMDFDEKLEIHGNISRNLDVSDPKSWGSAFKIKRFFESVYNKKALFMNEDWAIPETWVEGAVGRQIKVCAYKTTKAKQNGKGHWWDFYDIVDPANAPDGSLRNKVLKDVEDKWIKNYNSNDTASEISNNVAPSKTKSNLKPQVKKSTDFDFGNI